MERAAAGIPSRDVTRTSLWERLGALPEPGGTRFTVWAPLAERIEVALENLAPASVPMPLADFPGERNWGYDGAGLFAPARCYGAPDELRQLVDRAHQAGLAVHLDVVLNHLGPDGAYVVAFAPPLLAKHRSTGWGASM